MCSDVLPQKTLLDHLTFLRARLPTQLNDVHYSCIQQKNYPCYL
jgi:hypothetical protein